MTLQFHLPLGQPGLVAAANAESDFRQTVVFNGRSFGGNDVFAVYQRRNGVLSAPYRSGGALFDSASLLVKLFVDDATVIYQLLERAKEIAPALFTTTGPAKRHVANIYNKLGVSNRVEAIARAYQQGILDQASP